MITPADLLACTFLILVPLVLFLFIISLYLKKIAESLKKD